jgi:hypothetical protein
MVTILTTIMMMIIIKGDETLGGDNVFIILKLIMYTYYMNVYYMY